MSENGDEQRDLNTTQAEIEDAAEVFINGATQGLGEFIEELGGGVDFILCAFASPPQEERGPEPETLSLYGGTVDASQVPEVLRSFADELEKKQE